jgi:hypothetical protein
MREPGYYWVLLYGDWQPARWRARFGGECVLAEDGWETNGIGTDVPLDARR